jgi:tRNA uridine 5-carboxymethylaminomethyl modification enzyme
VYQIGLATTERYEQLQSKKQNIENIIGRLKAIKVEPAAANTKLSIIDSSHVKEKVALAHLLKRPEISLKDLMDITPEVNRELNDYNTEELEQAEIHIKYESYIEREHKLAEKIGSLEEFKIKSDFDYDRVKALSAEAREKLKKIRPETLGQATRISGVSPADVSVLTIYMGK